MTISKNDYKQKKTNIKKKLRAYGKALVYVTNTVNIISAKFAWRFINIEFHQFIFSSRKRIYMFDIIRNQLPSLNRGDVRTKPI